MLSLPADLYPAIIWSPVELDTLRCTCTWFSTIQDHFTYWVGSELVTRGGFRGTYGHHSWKKQVDGPCYSHSYTRIFGDIVIKSNSVKICADVSDINSNNAAAFAHACVDAAGALFTVSNPAHRPDFARLMRVFYTRVRMIKPVTCSPTARFPRKKRRDAAENSTWMPRTIKHAGVTVIRDDDNYTLVYSPDGDRRTRKYKYTRVDKTGDMIIIVNGAVMYYTGPREGAHQLAKLLKVYLLV